MAILGQRGQITLTDWANSIDPDGSVASVAELLTQQNSVLTDMPWIEGNLPTGHRSTIRAGLPTPTWRQLYRGVVPSKSVRVQVEDACGMLEARNEVDKDLADLNGNSAAFMLSEAIAQLEGMNQAFASTLIYGNVAINPERFTGFAPRFSGRSGFPAAVNVIHAGGSVASQQTSIWLVGWGPNTVHGIFPKGSQAGLVRDDLGVIDAFDDQSPAARFRAQAERFQWKCGLAVKDWRYIVRICNVDVANLLATSGFADVAKLLVRAFARIPNPGMCTPRIYCSRAVYTAMAIQALDKSQNAIAIQPSIQQYGDVSPGNAGGGGTLTFLGVPVRVVDAILDTEAVVPA
jgi:hypothetical protein